MLSISNQSLNNYSGISQEQLPISHILTRFPHKNLTIYNSNILRPANNTLCYRKINHTFRILLTENLKTLYKVQDTLLKLIEDKSIPEQGMEDYYIKLQIVLDDKKSWHRKSTYRINKIFDPIRDRGEVGKVIIAGIAGVGKTTLLNRIAYKWSKDELYAGKFDYVFKIRLRNLLDKHMINELSSYNREDILLALIQRSFEQQLIEQIDRTKVVLLLDGYDEIEHLNRGGYIVRELMSAILEYPNIILTSRFNALSSIFESRFQRKIENIGIGYDEAQEYIAKYFKDQSAISMRRRSYEK